MPLFRHATRARLAPTLTTAAVLAAGLGWAASAFNTSAHAQPAGGPPPAPAAAANTGPVRIAVVNVARIFNEMAETKVLGMKLAEDGKQAAAQKAEKEKAIQDMSAQRAGLNPNHPQFEEMSTKIMRAQVEYKVFLESQNAILEHNKKREYKRLFEKVQDAISAVARERQLDLVITDNKEPLPSDPQLDQLSTDAVKAILMQKDVLYSTDRMDISQPVLALLDKRYQGGAAPAAAAIPGAPAPAAPGNVNK